MKAQLREKALQLRLNENASYKEIREKVPVAKSTLSYWLREFPLTEDRIKELQRQGWDKSEASRERFRATMREKRKRKEQEVYQKYRKKFIIPNKESCFVAGLMLYLGEGDKKARDRIGLANTDPAIIKFFVDWLDTFLKIPKDKIKAQLHLYENMDIGKERKFWMNELGFTKSQIYRPSIRKLRQASFSYKESYRHGTCAIYSFGVDKKRELMAAVQAFLDSFQKINIKGT